MLIKHNYSGKSLLELREEYGIGSVGFYDNVWWLNENFAKEKPEVGVYEIELGEDLVELTFKEQIAKLKKGFEPIHPAVLTEAILEHYKKTGERLLENLYMRTCVVDSDGNRVFVGYFGSGGLGVDSWGDGDRLSDVGVASARKLGASKIESSTLPETLEINGVKYKRM